MGLKFIIDLLKIKIQSIKKGLEALLILKYLVLFI